MPIPEAYGNHFGAVPSQVDVCDKVDVTSRDPFLDSSYYSSFVYTLLDGSGEEITFDSTPAKDPTGEVQVSSKGYASLVTPTFVASRLRPVQHRRISSQLETCDTGRTPSVSHCSVFWGVVNTSSTILQFTDKVCVALSNTSKIKSTTKARRLQPR